MARSAKQGCANAEPLFPTETGRPPTKGTIGLLFRRLGEQAGIPEKTLAVSLVRKNFAERYVQTGGDPQTLLELLGQQKSILITPSLRTSDKMIQNDKTEAHSKRIYSEPTGQERS